MSIRTFRTIITAFFLCVFAVFAVYRVRMLLVSDNTAPVITAETDTMAASVSTTDEELLAGMTAYDNVDGDVTDTLVIASKSKFIKKGTLRVNYAAFDKSNNVATYTRELTYTDYESPKFSISQPLHWMTGDSRQNILEHITAQDCIGGDITQQIIYTLGDKRMISDTASVQTLNLQVTNSAGDTALLELEISFDDYNTYYTQAPHLSDYLMYIKVGENPDYRARLDGVWAGGITTSFADSGFSADDVQIDSSRVDRSKAGIYPVFYRLSKTRGDGSREILGLARLTVIVEE